MSCRIHYLPHGRERIVAPSTFPEGFLCRVSDIGAHVTHVRAPLLVVTVGRLTQGSLPAGGDLERLAEWRGREPNPGGDQQDGAGGRLAGAQPAVPS